MVAFRHLESRPRRSQGRILQCLQGARARPLAACGGGVTLHWTPEGGGRGSCSHHGAREHHHVGGGQQRQQLLGVRHVVQCSGGARGRGLPRRPTHRRQRDPERRQPNR